MSASAWAQPRGFDAAVQLLRESDEDRAKLIVAARLLAELSDRTNDENRLTEINSLLYWTKKQMTVAEATAFAATDREAAAAIDRAVDVSVQREDAADWLKRAEAYAEITEDPLLKAIRYWEVADRFVGTPESLKAQERSLVLMKQVATSARKGDRPVGAMAEGNGRLFVESNPKGAAIYIDSGDGLRSAGATTPASVRPPKGNVTVTLRKKGYRDEKVSIFVGDGIARVGPVALRRSRWPVVIITEAPGWWVYLNGEPAITTDGTVKSTPCTILSLAGTQKITVVKGGYRDRSKTVSVKAAAGHKKTEVIFDARPSRGRSRTMASAYALSGPKTVATPDGLSMTVVKDKVYACAQGTARPPFRITALVKTDNTNIRFGVCKGGVTLNWEVRQGELRVLDFRTGKSMGVRGKGRVPRDTYVRVDISCSQTAVAVAVNGEERFSRKGDYSRVSGKLGIGTAFGSTITVKSFTVSRELAVR